MQDITAAQISSPVYFLFGPTASGKTALAIELVQKFPLQIISADSAMVYRGMDIGTAKPTAAEQKIAPHYLIDCCDPEYAYSAGEFYRDALQKIIAVQHAGKIPLVVGGTMLYFNLLAKGMPDLPQADSHLRTQLERQVAGNGLESLYLELKNIDPEAADAIKPQDQKRILRALEIVKLSGKTQKQLQQGVISPLQGKFKSIALLPNLRGDLDHRLQTRIDIMFKNGLLDEVEKLHARQELAAETISMQAVGYKQLWQYFDGGLSLDEAKQKIFIATRRLVKHQMTWLARWKVDASFNCMQDNVIEHGLDYFSAEGDAWDI